jgi:hypothetical protein
VTSGRAAVVVTTIALCGVAGAGSASAATEPAAAPQSADLLNLAPLVSGLTDGLAGVTGGLTDTLGLTKTTAPVGADAVDESSGLVKVVRDLPLLGPALGGVVDSLPLLGSGAPAAGSTGSGSSPAKPAPATSNGHHRTTSTVSRTGSTWTAPTQPGLLDSGGGVSGGSSHHHGVGDAGAAVRNVASLLPESAAGKAGLGAAALALIVLGGVAVTGAAGAAGAAGRREFIGGAW